MGCCAGAVREQGGAVRRADILVCRSGGVDVGVGDIVDDVSLFAWDL
jgi:hypothetical protein